MKYTVREKLIALVGTFVITDETGRECYHVKEKLLSLSNKTYVYDMEDNEIAFIHKKIISLHETHYIEMVKSGEKAELSDAHYLQVHDNFEIEGFDWKINGGLMQHDFQILGSDGHLIAESHREWITLTEKFVVDIVDETQLEKVITVMMTLALTHRDRTLAAGDVATAVTTASASGTAK